jgi:ABC-type multidrug transport system ATPase subunit
MKLEINKLSKKYGDVYALREFSVTLSEGVYGLLGPNGAGKSTFMNILTDNLERTSGDILFDGADIRSMGAKYRSLIGYMPQQQGFYEQFTAGEFLRYIGELKDVKRGELAGQIEENLKRVHMYEFRNRKMGGLSGGMRQRVLLAQALLGSPKILILDEPTAGLDPTERIHMRNLIAEISMNKIIIIATHVVSDIEFISKNILLMKSGRLQKTGSPEELLQEMENRVFEIEVDAEDDSYGKVNRKIANVSVSTGGKILRVLSDEKPVGENVRVVRPTLEDFYLYYN